MTDATAPAPRRGWWWIGLAIFGLVLSAGLPIASTLLPVHRPLTLLLPSLAACALVGWWRGGSLSIAAVTLAGAVFSVWNMTQTGVSNDALIAGWSVVGGSCLGLSLMASRSQWFLGKGVVAVLSALIVSALLLAITPRGFAAFGRTVGTAVTVRGSADLTNWRVFRSQMARANSAGGDSATAAVLDRFEQKVEALPQLARAVLPAVLAMQTLVAMAIAWALFHRFSRTRLGEELGRLREFRFNDHWIWSVVVGLVLALLPALEALRPLGINLLVFFGALYAIRGAGVLAFFLRPGRSLLGLLVGIALLLLLRDGAVIALGLVGLGDTWADWRRRIRPAVS